MLKLLRRMRKREVWMAVLCAVLVLGQIYFELTLPDYMKELTDKPVYAVKGNCDLSRRMPLELTPELDGAKLLLCHGHERFVKENLYLLFMRAKAVGAQAALFGHTHVPLCTREEGVLLLNPGALKDGRYALLTIESDQLSAELKQLEGTFERPPF